MNKLVLPTQSEDQVSGHCSLVASAMSLTSPQVHTAPVNQFNFALNKSWIVWPRIEVKYNLVPSKR